MTAPGNMHTLIQLIKKLLPSPVYNLIKRLFGHPDYIQVKCPVEHHGSEYGGWTICPNGISEKSIVYSFGIGEDISFDLSLIDSYGLEVHAFDPTPQSIDWLKTQTLPENFHYYQYGAADYDGTIKLFPPEPGWKSSHMMEGHGEKHGAVEVPVRRIETLRDMLGHDRIDILKMDIEGMEYDVIGDMLSSGVRAGQVLVEFHHYFYGKTTAQTFDTIRLLNRHGYRIFALSPEGREISFIAV